MAFAQSRTCHPAVKRGCIDSPSRNRYRSSKYQTAETYHLPKPFLNQLINTPVISTCLTCFGRLVSMLFRIKHFIRLVPLLLVIFSSNEDYTVRLTASTISFICVIFTLILFHFPILNSAIHLQSQHITANRLRYHSVTFHLFSSPLMHFNFWSQFAYGFLFGNVLTIALNNANCYMNPLQNYSIFISCISVCCWAWIYYTDAVYIPEQFPSSYEKSVTEIRSPEHWWFSYIRSVFEGMSYASLLMMQLFVFSVTLHILYPNISFLCIKKCFLSLDPNISFLSFKNISVF